MGKSKKTDSATAETEATTGDEEIDTGPTTLQIETLSGDLRDAILREFKAIPKPWEKMAEHEQERLIHRASDIAHELVRQTIDVVASRGFECFNVSLGKITIDKGIKCEFTLPFSAESISALCSRKGDSVILVARDAREFAGEKKPAETDNVGDLAIPKNGAAEHASELNLQNLGRGPVQHGTA